MSDHDEICRCYDCVSTRFDEVAAFKAIAAAEREANCAAMCGGCAKRCLVTRAIYNGHEEWLHCLDNRVDYTWWVETYGDNAIAAVCAAAPIRERAYQQQEAANVAQN